MTGGEERVNFDVDLYSGVIMLDIVHNLQHWLNIKSTLVQRIIFTIVGFTLTVVCRFSLISQFPANFHEILHTLFCIRDYPESFDKYFRS